MSQGIVEPSDTSQGLDSGNPNPAWQPFLDKLPSELHPVIIPTLREWDQSVQNKLQDVHKTYDPYKEFVESKVDPEVVRRSLYLADQLESDPELLVNQVIEHFGLDYVKKAMAEANAPVSNSDNDDDDDFDLDSLGSDISKHPQFKQVMEQVTKMQETLDAKDNETKAEQEQREFEEVLNTLQETNKDKGDFDRLYVSALVTNGVEPAKAVDSYYNIVAEGIKRAGISSSSSGSPIPVVVGGEGVSGSGIPDQSIKMGDLKNGEVQDLIINMLKQQSQT